MLGHGAELDARPRTCAPSRRALTIHAAGPGDHLGELHVGSRSIFAAAGFEEVSHPTPRRVVMRIDF